MYEPESAWTAYYKELEPQKRLEIFNALAQRGEKDLAFRRKLYEERYRDPKHPDRTVDLYLWKCVYLPGLYKKRRIPFSGFRQEVEKTLEELHLDAPETLSEAEKTALYLEFRNAARRYLSTCRSERYASRLMGLKKATAEEKRRRACEEIWMMSRGLALASGKEENFKLFSNALYEELLRFHPDCRDLYALLEAQAIK